MGELCTCRYCASDNVNLITKIYGKGFKEYFVRCGNCYATGGRTVTEADAIDSWNRINTEESDLVKFKKMLDSSEFSSTYTSKKDKLAYDGDILDIENIIIPNDERNLSAIEAVFLTSSEEFLGFRIGKIEEKK